MAGNLFRDRLLVVDDDPGFGRIMKKAAEQSGFEVLVAEDARIVAKTARSWLPTVILLDLQMPNIDGIEVLRALAADKSGAHIILTSGADGKVVESAMQLGRDRGLKMAGVLPKPIRINGLRKILAGFKPVSKTLLSADLADATAAGQLFLESSRNSTAAALDTPASKRWCAGVTQHLARSPRINLSASPRRAI